MVAWADALPWPTSPAVPAPGSPAAAGDTPLPVPTAAVPLVVPLVVPLGVPRLPNVSIAGFCSVWAESDSAAALPLSAGNDWGSVSVVSGLTKPKIASISPPRPGASAFGPSGSLSGPTSVSSGPPKSITWLSFSASLKDLVVVVVPLVAASAVSDTAGVAKGSSGLNSVKPSGASNTWRPLITGIWIVAPAAFLKNLKDCAPPVIVPIRGRGDGSAGGAAAPDIVGVATGELNDNVLGVDAAALTCGNVAGITVGDAEGVVTGWPVAGSILIVLEGWLAKNVVEGTTPPVWYDGIWVCNWLSW